MRRFAVWTALAAVMVLGVLFAVANGGRMVSINLGLFTLSRVPVTFVAFGGMVAGMGVVLLAGLNADLKVRRLLREREEQDSLAERSVRRSYDEHGQGDMRLE